MGLFKNIFGKKEEASKIHRGFHVLKVSKKEFLTSDMVQFTFDTTGNESTYKFIPGQYMHGYDFRGSNDNQFVPLLQFNNYRYQIINAEED